MTKIGYFRVTNTMLFSSLISNGIGVAVVQFLTQRSASALSPEILRLTEDINKFFLPASFILPFVLIRLYERPIRAYLKKYKEKCSEKSQFMLPFENTIMEAQMKFLKRFYPAWINSKKALKRKMT